MNKTFQIAFRLKNSYRANSVIFSLKQVPLLKRILPDSLYGFQDLKVLANIIAGVWEFFSIFAGKFLYLLLLFGICPLYSKVNQDQMFLHLLFFLTIIGAFMNTYLFNPTKDKFYAVMLMRMNAREYALTDYTYAILKVIVGFLPFSLFFGLYKGVPLWICLLIPFFVAGAKLLIVMVTLHRYEKTGKITNENQLGRFGWIVFALLMAAACIPPAAGFVLPAAVSAGLMIAVTAGGLLSVWKVAGFKDYKDVYRQILSQAKNQMDLRGQMKTQTREQSRKMISADTTITSRKKGFEYLNELFIRRHQRLLWKTSRKIALVSLGIVCAALLGFYLSPEFRKTTNELLMVYLPYFVFIMYAINRGTGFTQALFMNCDHSLLTYSFYKQPKFVLKLFQIRLREIVKVNLLPAAVIGGGLAGLLYASGGTENPVNYAVLFVSVICLSIFFSVHYLTIYYLLQPYNAGTEIKSATYRIVTIVTYFICFFMMQIRMSTMIFGGMTILFCVLYCIAASVLVYKFAPKTFKLRV